MNKVYFVKASNGMIKIGKSNNPSKRLKALATGSPLSLKVVKVITGGVYLEQALHKYFSNCRSHGEWFNPGKELTMFIQGKKPIYVDNLIEANNSNNIIRYLKKLSKETYAIY